MPKINVYLPDQLADAVRDAQLPVSAICQAALEKAVREVTSARNTQTPPAGDRQMAGLFTRFTDRARTAIVRAQEIAREVPHSYIGTEHILLGILDEGGNLGIKVLASLDIEPTDLRDELIASMGKPTAASDGFLPFTPLAKQVLEATTKESLMLGHNYIGCEHLLLALIAVEEGVASQVLRRMGIELKTTRRAVTTTLVGFVHAHASASRTDPTMAEILRRLDAIETRLAD